MALQVEAFHDVVERPITIIAESKGALVAKAYLLAHPGAPVDTLVLLEPAGRAVQRLRRRPADDGWGAAAGFSLTGSARRRARCHRCDVKSDDGLFRSLADLRARRCRDAGLPDRRGRRGRRAPARRCRGRRRAEPRGIPTRSCRRPMGWPTTATCSRRSATYSSGGVVPRGGWLETNYGRIDPRRRRRGGCRRCPLGEPLPGRRATTSAAAPTSRPSCTSRSA